MPLFKTSNQKAQKLLRKDFANEKELQHFVETNLEELFGIRFLASEYSTNHGGRIDSLGLDENNSPVIIEYKWGENSAIINQGLFYLDWLVDHIAEFQLLVQKKIAQDVEVDTGSPRLILIAASYSKFDEYAINRMAENIEMWSYNQYPDLFELKLVASSQAKKVENGKKVTKVNYDSYSVEDQLEGKSEKVKELFNELQERILAFDSEGMIEELARKMYIAYRTNKNFVYLNFRSDRILVDVAMVVEHITSLDASDPAKVRDMRAIGHHGAGYTRYELSSLDQLDEAVALIRESYEQTK
ncbi:DUF5655 domain-containing protein [Candidatus Woesebacteria bacterium]|nr:DUF5655 domain-containing protein [Candidatus Woesebacteria bacterium]MCD8527587.1 DUF5655 domain-containing protein [Candidatus Woesebacteria bacterium]MCD8546441.1 DUF5655 domain-containing protein [Candidatus Woesebacteria bacterium]